MSRPVHRILFVCLEFLALKPADFAGRLALFLDVAGSMGTREVPDPYHMGPEGFEHVLDLIEEASAALAASLASR